MPAKSTNAYSNQELSRYSEVKDSLRSVPYIAALFGVNDESGQVFALGDGKNYSQPRIIGDTSKVEHYFNGPLQENSTYSVFQRFFKNKNDYYSTDWSPPATTNTIQSCGLKAATKTSKNSLETSLFVGIGISLGLNVVLIVLMVIYLTVCRARSRPLISEEVGTKVENKACSDDIYDEAKCVNNEALSTYEELNLEERERERDEHAYQSLTK